MNKEQLERALKYTEEKHKNDSLVICTTETNISAMCSDTLDILSRCIEIPDGATNGSIIRAMFPNAIIQINDDGDMVHVKYNNNTCWVNYELDWWDSQFKKAPADKETDKETDKEMKK